MTKELQFHRLSCNFINNFGNYRKIYQSGTLLLFRYEWYFIFTQVPNNYQKSISEETKGELKFSANIDELKQLMKD